MLTYSNHQYQVPSVEGMYVNIPRVVVEISLNVDIFEPSISSPECRGYVCQYPQGCRRDISEC